MSTIDTTAFLDNGKPAVQVLRQTLANVLSSVGGDPAQPQDLSRRFGLDKTLTWRIAKVVREENAWESIPHIPRRPSMRIFLRAMEKHGAPSDAIESVWAALENFEEFIHTHTGDRETLEAMVGGAAKKAASKRMETFRKSAYQANSAIWGVRAKAQTALKILSPTSDPDSLTLATVAGFVDFRRLRPDVPWEVAAVESWEVLDDPSTHSLAGLTALDNAGVVDGIPLLGQFCTQPLPELRTVNVTKSYRRYELCEGPVGNTAAASVMLGWRWSGNVSAYETIPGETGEHGAPLATPVETLIFDMLVHRSLPFAFNLEANLFSRLASGPQLTSGPSTQALLPVPTEIIDLGSGPPDLTTPEVPRYREMAEHAVRCMGHKLEEFHGFRYRLKYPPIPTFAMLRHPLLKRK